MRRAGKAWSIANRTLALRGELIPEADTVYLCQGEIDAISLIDGRLRMARL